MVIVGGFIISNLSGDVIFNAFLTERMETSQRLWFIKCVQTNFADEEFVMDLLSDFQRDGAEERKVRGYVRSLGMIILLQFCARMSVR